MYPSDKTELYFNKVSLSGRKYSIYVLYPSPHRLCSISWPTSPGDQTKMIRETEYQILWKLGSRRTMMESLSADTDVFRSAVATLAISFVMPWLCNSPEFWLNMHLKYPL